MSQVSLVNINKIYPGNVQAVFNVNLAIERREFIVLVGPSGCGKTT
ncbi:MAG: sugar ABC transporter ATP-binding protein, partial [Candidatus Omnitrophota bacterium]